MARLGHAEEQRELDDTLHYDILRSSLDLCRQAVDRVSEVGMTLQGEMKQRKLRSAIKMVLKRDTIGKMLSKLDRSKGDLHIGYSMYSDARKSRDLDRLQRCVEEMRGQQVQTIGYIETMRFTATPTQPDQTTSVSRVCPRTVGKQERRSRLTRRIRLPQWL